MLKFLNFSAKFAIIFFAVVVFFVFSTLWYFSVGLPDYKKLSNYQPPISSRSLSEDNKLSWNMIIHTFRSILDKSNAFFKGQEFFSHLLNDAKGITRAVIKI